jgi:asparagine synthase (glutamine-hydrolysing)
MVDALPVSHGYMSLDFKLKRGLAGVAVPAPMRIPAWMAPVSADEVNALVRDGMVHTREEIYSEAIEAWNQAAALGQEEGALQVFTDLYLQDDILTKVDRASMQHSLEVRAPFLDIEVADFARRLPTDHKLRGGTTKWLLRQAAQGLVPREVIERPKQGFAVPVGRWFAQGQLAVDPGSLPACFDREGVAALAQQHRSGRQDQRLALWALLSLSRSAGGAA